ncbi:conserved oligomeric Golgi complex subunit 6 [Tanacetum coccineum]
MGTTTSLPPRTLDLLSSLNTLSSFYTDNTPPARRNLQSTIEKRSIQINHHFLLASNTTQQALDKMEDSGRGG